MAYRIGCSYAGNIWEKAFDMLRYINYSMAQEYLEYFR